MSSREPRANHLDIAAFARNAGSLSGQAPVGQFPRLLESLHHGGSLGNIDTMVAWSAQGRIVKQRGGAFETWVDLQAQVVAPLTCQACLEATDTPIQVSRSFRFVATEALAAELDESAEEDVLVSSRSFDLLALVEDELLLALPLVPRHEVCPQPLPLPEVSAFLAPDSTLVETGIEDPQPHPFAALKDFKPGAH